MRQLFSLLCLVLAGLLSVGSLAGYQVDQLLRSEEPIRYMAGDLPQQEQFSEAVSQMIVGDLVARLPDGIESYIPGGVETAISNIVGGLVDNERTRAAWDETLQSTRYDYAVQLERLFETGTTGDPQELAIDIDLSPVFGAMTEPLREGLEQAFGWLPFVDADAFEFLAPEIMVDIEAATDDEADPYTWATVAVGSQYWIWLAATAGVLAMLGLLLGGGKSRWVALAVGSTIAGGMGLWIATTAASPNFEHPAALPEAASIILDHVEHRFTQWAQPSWWIFTAVAGFAILISILAALVTPSRRLSH